MNIHQRDLAAVWPIHLLLAEDCGRRCAGGHREGFWPNVADNGTAVGQRRTAARRSGQQEVEIVLLLDESMMGHFVGGEI